MKRSSISHQSQPGVNLGGWLVLERWMTPSIFADTDAANEYELWQTPGGAKRISHHRNTFITEDDISWIAQSGVKLLRVPIGYWVLDDQPPYRSARQYLDWLMEMAARHQLKVLLCLHAAPGAQNANDHSGSGRPGPVGWYKRRNKRATTDILQRLATAYRDHPALWGIELLNEPLTKHFWHRWQLLWWTRRTIRALRCIITPGTRLVVSDCYQPNWWSGRILGETLDIHHYQCFSDADHRATSYVYHRQKLQTCTDKYQRYAKDQPIIIGEWSSALPPRTNRPTTNKRFWRDQLQTPAHADAWFFWSYKTEASPEWDFRHASSWSAPPPRRPSA